MKFMDNDKKVDSEESKNITVPEVSKEEEYLNNWKRAQADFINYKKDEGKRMEDFAKFATENVIEDILDVLGNLELAAGHIKDQGLTMVMSQFESLLKKYGVERIAVAGQTFDPAVHEAVEAIVD